MFLQQADENAIHVKAILLYKNYQEFTHITKNKEKEKIFFKRSFENMNLI